MPESVSGLALFVVLLAPGFAYVWRRERLLPRRTPSVFRETTEVVLASVAGGIAALGLLAVVRVLAPEVTPDVGRVIREGASYFKGSYQLVAAWAAVLLTVAVLFAFWAAGPKEVSSRLFDRFVPNWVNHSDTSVIAPHSSWWEMFREEVGPGETVWVSCLLGDSTYLAGALGSFSTETEETNDRDLVLIAPVQYRGPNEDEVTTFQNQSVIVNSTQILYIGATYLTPSQPASDIS